MITEKNGTWATHEKILPITKYGEIKVLHLFNKKRQIITNKLLKEVKIYPHLQINSIFQMFLQSSGIDNIGPTLLKLAAPFLSKSFIYIFNSSIKTGSFHDSLKSAKVKPILKAGDKSDPNNYRPISVLPTLLKNI